MSVNSAQLTISSVSATQIFVQGSSAGQFTSVVGDVTEGLPTILVNMDAAITIFLGPSGVTTTTGFPLLANQSIPITFVGGDAPTLFALAASGSPKLGVLAARQQ